jgi:hypothetical protein
MMATHIYYHGTNGDHILSIIASGVMRPNEKEEIFFARYRWDSCLMHGADRKRKATFVIKVQAEVADDLAASFVGTPGVQDTLILHTDRPIPVKVLELFVRTIGEDGAEIERHVGEPAIRRFLTR